MFNSVMYNNALIPVIKASTPTSLTLLLIKPIVANHLRKSIKNICDRFCFINFCVRKESIPESVKKMGVLGQKTDLFDCFQQNELC